MSVENASPPEGGQGAPPVSPPAAPPVENVSAPAAPPPPPAFHATFENPEDRGYAENKGWKTPVDLLQSYRNLEKLRGVPAERLAQMPEDWTNQEQVKAFFEKLPETFRPPAEPGDYGFAAVEGVDPARAKVLEGLAHKHGVPKSQASALFSELVALETEQAKAEEAQYIETVAVERGKLRADVGEAKWDEFLEQGRRFARRFGLTEENINTLENNIGYTATMTFLNRAGGALSEAAWVDAEKKNPTMGMTPEAAKDKRDTLMRDSEFIRRYTQGGHAEKEQIERLNRIISGA